jgi:hypothetical protein
MTRTRIHTTPYFPHVSPDDGLAGPKHVLIEKPTIDFKLTELIVCAAGTYVNIAGRVKQYDTKSGYEQSTP